MKAKKILLTFLMTWLASLYAVGQSAEIKLIVTGNDFQDFISGNLSAFKNTDITKGFTVRNTGNSNFTGVISYTDSWGSSLSLKDIVVSYEGGALPSGTSIKWKKTSTNTLNGTLTSGATYQLLITNLPPSIGSNKGLVFARRVHVTSCIDDDKKGRSVVEMNVCDTAGKKCIPMTDAWQGGTTRLIQQLNKAKSEFIDVFDIDFTANDFCAYNVKNPVPASGFSKVSYFTKMHNQTSGETVKDFAIKVASSGNEEIPLSQVFIYKAIYNTTTKTYVKTGTPLKITAINDPLNGSPIIKSPTRCFSDPVGLAYFPLGNITGTDAFYVEFKVYNCQPTIDLKNFTTSSYDGWASYWEGKDDCDALMGTAATATGKNGKDPMGNQQIGNTSFFFNHTVCGACYGDYVDDAATYVERVSTLMFGETGNCRLDNLFVNNTYAFLGTSYSDGVNYQANRAKLIIVLKLEPGLKYYQGTGAGGYYPFLEFRNPDGKNWAPINHAGTAVAYKIPTDENPKYAYNDIRMFEFDMKDLYALYPKLAQSNFDEKSTILYDYINNADIAYSLSGDCAAPKKMERPHYSVEMYLVADASCPNSLVMPSFKITKDANIMCPGCQFPGGAGRFAHLKRLTYGETDANENGISDNSTPLTTTMVDALNADNNPDNNIRTKFGIVGDRVQMNTRYYLTSAESCSGVTYDDMMIGALKYSYLRISFPYDTFKVDKTIPFPVTISSGGTNYKFKVPAAILLTQTGGTTNLFEININKMNSYLAAGSPALPVNFRFKSSDEVEIEFYMDIAYNSTTKDAYEEVSFAHSPYFSSTPVTSYVRDFPQFSCDKVLGPVVKGPGGTIGEHIPKPPFTDPNYKNTWLLCEGYEAIFNLVRVNQDYWYGDGYASDWRDKSCEKARLLSIVSTLGKYEAPKLFVNEFRPAPMIDEIDIITPQGYRFDRIDRGISDAGKTAPLYYSGGSYVGPGVQVGASVTTSIQGINYTKTHLTLPDIYTKVTDVDVAAGTNQNKMRQIDEHLLNAVWVYHEADCSNIPDSVKTTPEQPTDTTGIAKNFRYKMFFDLDPLTDQDVFISQNPGNEFASPENQLTSSLSSTGIVAVSASKFNLDFSLNNGTNGSQARFPFATVQYDITKFSTVDLSSVLPNVMSEITRSTVGNIVTVLYKIDPTGANRPFININSSVDLKITGSLAGCFNDPNAPELFEVGYGWDCTSWPTSIADYSSLCYYTSEKIKAYSIAAGMLTDLKAESVDASCNVGKIHYSYKLTSTGSEINKVQYLIDLPNGLTLDTTSLKVKYGSKGITRPLHYTFADSSTVLNTNVTGVNLNDTVFKPVPFAGAVVQGLRNEVITVDFDALVNADCGGYDRTNLSSIKTRAAAFCGQILLDSNIIRPTYRPCPDSFAIHIIGQNIICANEDLRSNATMRVVIPKVKNNCFAGPLTYQWTVKGDATVIGTADTIVVRPSVTTTYQVVVRDGFGFNAKAEYTVYFDYEYKIGDVNWVCGSNNKSICVPITANIVVHDGIIGMDFTMRYDKRYVTPNSTVLNANIGSVVTGLGYAATYATSINPNPSVETNPNIGHVNISIYYLKSSAYPDKGQFSSLGLVICVPFTIVGNPVLGTTSDFTMREMTESYTLYERSVCWGKGTLHVIGTGNFVGALEYHLPYAKIGGNYKYSEITHNLSTTYGAFNTIQVLDSCGGKVLGTYNGTDKSNGFNIPLTGKNVIKINRDINNKVALGADITNGYLTFVNGTDTRAMEYITTLDAKGCVDQLVIGKCPIYFIPTATQMIAADVNMSDSVRANDITEVQRRIVGEIQEFKQVPNKFGKPSLDWRFVDPAMYTNSDFTISSQYPFNETNNHYWRDNVPTVPECFAAFEQCANDTAKIFRGILLGDVINQTSKYYYGNRYLKKDDGIQPTPFVYNVLLKNAVKINSSDYVVPITYFAPDSASAYAFDLGLEYKSDSVEILDFTASANVSLGGHLMWNNDKNNSTLRTTNFAKEVWGTKGICYYVTLRKPNGGAPDVNDFKSAYGMINGDWANVEYSDTHLGINPLEEDLKFSMAIYPNPLVDQSIIYYQFSALNNDNYIVITNTLGQVIQKFKPTTLKGQITLDKESIGQGVYFCTIYDKEINFSKTVKFIVE
jgi:hypothetical protein